MKWEEIDELSRRSLKRLIEVVAEEEKGKEGRIVEKIVEEMLESGNVAAEKERRGCYDYRLTSSLRTPKFFVKEFSYFLMPCHQHGLRINLLVQR